MKKQSLWGMLALLLTFGFVLTSCSTIDTLSPPDNRGVFQYISVPDKDFNSLGLVFVEKSYDQDEKGVRGDIFTYYALLQEAKKLGGDYIINVTIDVRSEGTFNALLGKQGDLVKGKVTWYGAATAIKYTNAMKETTTTTATPASTTVINEKPSISSGSSNPASTTGGSNSKGFLDNLFKKK